MQPRPPFGYNRNNPAAASSMVDLSSSGRRRKTSFSSLHPTASDINLRMNFANTSSTSLALPGPGFGSRPTTPGGTSKSKPWVNPLDIQFAKNAPLSSLGQYELKSDGSLFGDTPEAVAQAIMESVEKNEKEERDRGKLREREQERMDRELEQNRAREKEREKENERDSEWQRKRVIAARSPPPSPGISTSRQGLMNGPMSPTGRPKFQGQIDTRPGSRGGLRTEPMSPTIDRPRFHGHVDERPSSRGGMGTPPMNENMGRPVFQGQVDSRPSSRGGISSPLGNENLGRPVFQGQVDSRPSSRGGMRDAPAREYTNRPVFQGNVDQRPESRDGTRNWPIPGPINGATNSTTPSLMNGSMKAPMNNAMNSPERSRDSPPRRDISGMDAFSTPTSPIRSSEDDQSLWEGKPVIRNVQAMRDTLTISTARRQSLTMRIEELEKSLIEAQQAQEGSPRKDSASSSRYSADTKIESPQSPRQLRSPSPPFAAAGARRTQSPMRGPIRNGPPPRRPNPEEYGVPVARITPDARPRMNGPGATVAPPIQGLRRAGTDDSTTSLPSPRTGPNPLQFRQPNWGRREQEGGMSQDKYTRPRPSPTPPPNALNMNSNHETPPTPDSTNWPLSPLITSHAPPPPPGPTTQPNGGGSPVSLASPGLPMARPKIPPPLNFDFSPQGYSRAPGPFTPPPRRTTGERDWPGSLEARRPGTAGLAPSAVPLAPATAVPDSEDAAGLGAGLHIGVARGLSVREAPGHGERRPNHGLTSPTGIADNFGTGFI